jgi:hypothetical protein
MMALDPVSAALSIGSQIIERVWPDPAQQAAAKLELLKLQQSGELAIITAQTEINKVEAANPNVFVSGWRPAAGWICVLGMAYTFFVQPLLGWASGYFGIPLPPNIDTSDLFILLGGMLGLGGLRSFEKFNGVAK